MLITYNERLAPMKDKIVLTDLKAIKAYSEPYKIMILQHYYRLHRPATVKQIADIMDQVPAKVHYHVKRLEEVGILKLSHTKEVNGITAKFYQPVAKHFEVSHDALSIMTHTKIDPQFHQHTLNDIFDSHKSHCINAIHVPSSTDPFVLSTELYLNQQEYKDLVDYLEKLHQKCQRKNGKKRHYRLLTSISQNNSYESV